MIVRLQDNPHIIVKPETYPITVTGNTYYNFIASGETVITQVQTGNLVDVTIYNPSGSSATWGMIVGDITNQTDLYTILTGMTADIQANTQCCTGNTAAIDYHYQQFTGFTDYFATLIIPAITGNTQDISDLSGAFDSHSGNTLIHFEKTDISYNDLQDLPSLFSGDYDDLTNKPDLSVYQPVSGMSVYLTGVTWNDVTNKPDLTLQSDFTGHTSDLTIHYPQSGISITESQISDLQAYALQSAFDTYTGTTAPASFLSITGLTGYWTSAQTENYVTGLGYITDYTVTADDVTGITASLYAPIVHTHSYNDLTDLPTLFTGHTFIASGGTIISQTGDEVTIYAPTGATGASGLTPTLSFTGVSVVNYTQVGTAYTIGLQAASGITPTLVFSGVSGTTIDYTQSGATYYIDVQGEKGDTGDSGVTPTFVFSGMSGTVVDYTQSGDTYYIEVTGVQGGAGSGATILISSGATIATYISGSTTGNTWNVYSPDYNYVNIKSITGASYTTIAGDSNKILECASGCTGMTLHSGATTGFQLTIVSLGTQTITFTAQSGSTLRSKDSAVTLVNQYGAVTAYKNNTYWTLIGDLS